VSPNRQARARPVSDPESRLQAMAATAVCVGERSGTAAEESMGAKTWMLVYATESPRRALGANPVLDRAATLQLAGRLFSGDNPEEIGAGDLSCTCPPDDEIHIGCFPGVSIVAAKEFGIDNPSKLSARFVDAGRTGTIHLHAMHSVVDWFAYAQWIDGKLRRSLSLSPDHGIMEDVGPRLPFEEPYWSGAHPPFDEGEDQGSYPFPFHPLELGEAALGELFGYQLEGSVGQALLEPETVPLIRYRRTRSRWKFWK
jgi:hypothetical protein